MQKKWPTLSCPSNDGTKFWSHEWEKHGTCSEDVLDKHAYFQAALKLKDDANLLGALQNAGINPNGGSYSLDSIKEAITTGTGHTPWIQCSDDGGSGSSSGNSQLYQVYLCVDRSGNGFIEIVLKAILLVI